jgi:hypothetical protein
MQIGGESVENMFMNMMLENKMFSKTQIQKWVKQILVWNYSRDNLWLMKFKVILLKLTPMNHYH